MNHDDLINLYHQESSLSIAGDLDALAALLADNFYLVHMTGMKQTKAEWLTAMQTSEMQYHDAIEDYVEVKKDAEVIGQSRVHATIWGMESTWRLQLHLYCVQQAGRACIDHIVASTY